MKKKTLLILVLNILTSVLLRAQPNPPGSGGDFATNDTLGCAPYVVDFVAMTPNAVSWHWNFGNGNTSTQSNPTQMYTSPGLFTVVLDVVYADGSTGHLVKTDYIEVAAKPTINIALDPFSSCLNTNFLQFHNNTTNGVQYLWDFGDGNLSGDVAPSHHYDTPGNYDVTFFATNSLGCTKDTTLSNIVINPVVQNSIQLNGISNTCDPAYAFQFEAAPSGLTSYAWEFSDGFQANGMTVQHAFNAYGNFDAQLITTDNNGCSDTTSAMSIVEVEQITDDFTASSTTACKLSDVAFMANASGASSVTWDFGDGQSATGANVNHAYQNTGQYDITMVSTRPNGCGQTIIKSNYLNVTDPSTIQMNVSDTLVCVNEMIQFEGVSSNAQTVEWIFGDGSSSSAFTTSHTYTAGGQYEVKLIHSAGGCYDTLVKSITVAQPTAGFHNDALANCSPVDIQFTSNSIGAVSWQWSFSNGATSVDEDPFITFNGAGQYDAQLIVQDINGCSDTAFVEDAITVSNNIPTNFQQAYFNGCAPLSISLYNYSLGSGYWSWNFGDGGVGNGMIPAHTYNAPGEYVVSLHTMDTSGCNFFIDTFAVVRVSAVTIDSLFVGLDCDSLEVDFSVTCPFCDAGYWDLGDGTTSNSSSVSHEYSGHGPYDVSYLGVSNYGCSNLTLFSVDLDSCVVQGTTLTGTVPTSGDPSNWVSDPNPGNNAVPYNSYCGPVTVSIDNPVPNAQSWTWHFGDGEMGTGPTPIHTYDSVGLFTLTLDYFDGTSNQTLYFHNFINVMGYTNNITVNADSYCNNMQLNLVSEDTTLADYFWSVDNQLISHGATAMDTLFVNSNQLHAITLTTLDSNQCSYSASIGIFAGGIEPMFTMDSIICLGDSLIVEHNLPAYYQVSLTIDSTITTNNAYYIFSSPGIHDVSVIVTDTSGCETLFGLGSVAVFSSNSSFNLTSAASLCVGDTVYFSALDPDNDSYSWDFNNVAMISGGVNAKGVVQSAGMFDVTLETNSNGCISSTTQYDVYIVNQAVADFTYTQDNLCLPIAAQFTDLSSSPVSWSWDFGDGSTSSIQHPGHIYITDANTPVTLTITDINGCKASVSKANIDIFNASIELASAFGCAPAPIGFSDGSQNAISWMWDFGDGTSDTIQSPTHVYTNDGTYDVSLIVLSADGCVDSIVSPALVNIDRVEAMFTSSVNNGCAPQPAYFSDNSYNAVSWHWNFGNGASSTQQNPVQVYYVGGNYSVELIVESALGCVDTMISPSPLTIMGPHASFALQDPVICDGEELDFINNSQNASSFAWLFGNGDSSTDSIPSYSYGSSGNYEISLIATDANGCQHIASESYQITVESLPNAEFTVSDTIGCNPLPISFIASSSGATYQWELDGNIVGSNSGYSTSLTTGLHTVTLVVQTAAGCIDSSVVSNIEVHPVYTVQLSPVSPVCETETMVEVNSSTSMGDWYLNGIPNPNNQFDITGLTPGDYLISQEISTLCGDADSVVLHIDALLTATIGAPEKVCENEPSFLLTSSTNIGYWSGAGVVEPFGGEFDPASANYGYNTLTYNIVNGSCLFMDSVELFVTRTPSSSFSVNDPVLCEGRRLEISVSENDPSSVYSWSFIGSTDTILSMETIPSVSLSPGEWNISLEVDNDGCFSVDSMIGVHVYDTLAPHTPSIIRSTVIDNSAVLTEWEEPLYGAEKILNYQIWKSVDSAGFSLAGIVDKEAQKFIDYETNVEEQNYYYMIIPSNVCNVAPQERNMSSSILLEKEIINETHILFNWTQYYQWLEGVDYYELQRKNEFGEWEILKTMDGKEKSVMIERP